MAARVSIRSLHLPDICYTPFQNILTSHARNNGPMVFARGLRVIHPVEE